MIDVLISRGSDGQELTLKSVDNADTARASATTWYFCLQPALCCRDLMADARLASRNSQPLGGAVFRDASQVVDSRQRPEAHACARVHV